MLIGNAVRKHDICSGLGEAFCSCRPWLLRLAFLLPSLIMSASSMKEKDVEAIASPTLPENGEIQDISPRNADDALDFLQHEGAVREMTAEDEQKLRRKIDWMIMPLMWSCYCLQYLDKTLINYANVMVRFRRDIRQRCLLTCWTINRAFKKIPTCLKTNSVTWHSSSTFPTLLWSSLTDTECRSCLRLSIWGQWCFSGASL